METSQTDNAGKRLLTILRRARDPNFSNAPPVMAWAKVFGIVEVSKAPNDPISDREEFEVGQRLVQLHKLINEVESQLKAIEDLDHELFLRSFPTVKSVCRLSVFNQSTLVNVMNQLGEGDLTVLEFCGNELSKHYSEVVVDEQVLKDYTAQVNALFDEIENADLPKELKTFLLKQLETIRRAIQEYRIRGVERLKEALEQVAGSMLLNEELIKGAKDKEEVSKFSKVFYGLVSIVTFASKLTPLIGPAKKAFGLLLPIEPNAVPPINLPPGNP